MIRGLHPGNHRRLIAVVTNIIVLLGVVSDCDNNESDCAESAPTVLPLRRPGWSSGQPGQPRPRMLLIRAGPRQSSVVTAML